MSEGANDTSTGMPASAVGVVALHADARSNRPGRTRIVVVGEFNSGKTTLVNALVGAPVLTPSCIAHTTHLTVVGYAAKPSLTAETANRKRTPVAWNRLDDVARDDIRRVHVGAPLERLKQLSVMDTPGLGFADSESDQRSLQPCRNADAVIWCTPAMQAWKASEERAWLALPERVRERGILAVTFGDEIASRADVDRLMERLRAEAGPYFRKVVMADECAALALEASRRGSIRKPRRRKIAPRTAIGIASAQLR
jgi:GTPase Era involved in 16S rRNA processing